LPYIVLVIYRAVTESINDLIAVCSVSAAPGQKECDAAVRQIQVTVCCMCFLSILGENFELNFCQCQCRFIWCINVKALMCCMR